MGDKVNRSFAKTFSWRFFATLDTIIIAYFVTGDPITASLIAGIEVFTKILLYYLHERIWNRINFGKSLD